MRIKYSFLEKEIIGIGVYRISYETNIRMEDYPACAMLKEKTEEKVLSQFGATLQEAREDSSYSMDYIVRKKAQLGVSVPGDNYTLVITSSKTIKRMERTFQIQEGL